MTVAVLRCHNPIISVIVRAIVCRRWPRRCGAEYKPHCGGYLLSRKKKAAPERATYRIEGEEVRRLTRISDLQRGILTLKSASYNAIMMGITRPSQYNSITSKAPGIPASAQIRTVIQFMGTGSPRNFANARTIRPNIELTTRYRIVLPRSITATKQ